MKQQAIHFVGLDVDQSTVVASVRDESEKVVMKATVPTEEKAIVALVRNPSWPVKLRVTSCLASRQNRFEAQVRPALLESPS